MGGMRRIDQFGAPVGEGPVVCASNSPASVRKKADYQASSGDAGTTINAALAAAGQGRATTLLPGKYTYTTPIVPVQDCILEGTGRGGLSNDTTTSTWLSFQGGATDSAIAYTAAADLSRVELARFRLTDDRVTKTSGSTILLKRVKNRVVLREMLIAGAPDNGIYVGADSGHSSDCLEIDDVWSTAGQYGINLERLDNVATVHGIKGDSYLSAGATMLALIRVALIGSVPASAVVHISDVKHECSNGADTVLIPDSSSGGATLIEGAIMRGLGSGGGYVVHIAAGEGTGLVCVDLAHDGSAAGTIRNDTNGYTVTTNPLAYWAGGQRGIGINDFRLYGLNGGGSVNPKTGVLRGHLQYEADNTYDIGSASLRPRTVRSAGKVLAAGGIGVGNSASGSSLGTVVKKVQLFDETGASLGYVPIYDAIT